MLNPKQIRMLELLDKQVSNCRKCSICVNGKCTPQWTSKSKYVIISESPTYLDIRKNSFFNGGSGTILTDLLSSMGFNYKEFLLINSIQCRPSGAGGKPNVDYLNACEGFIRKYIKVINPEKILCLGNYSKYIFTRKFTGVLSSRGIFKNYDLGGVEFPVIFTIHPAYCMYNSEDGIPILRQDLKTFKDTKFEQRHDWFFSMNDFLI